MARDVALLACGPNDWAAAANELIDGLPAQYAYLLLMRPGVRFSREGIQHLVYALEPHQGLSGIAPIVGSPGKGGARLFPNAPHFDMESAASIEQINVALGSWCGQVWHGPVEPRRGGGEVAALLRLEAVRAVGLFDNEDGLPGPRWSARASAMGRPLASCRSVYVWWGGAKAKATVANPAPATAGQGPRLSVCLGVISHNYGRYLHRCLSSIIRQTLVPDRIVVVDDLSDEGDLAEEIAASYPVEYVKTSFGNANRARNVVFARSTEDAILFLDADDWLVPLAIERMVERMWATGADVVYCDWHRFFDRKIGSKGDRRSTMRSRPFDAEVLRSAGNYIIMPSLIRERSFPGFDGKIVGHQDWDAWLTLAEMGRKFEYLPEPLVCVWVHPQSLSRRSPEERARVVEAVARKHGLSTRLEDICREGLVLRG